MQRAHVNKGKARAQKPYERITLSKTIQDRLSKYVAGDTSQGGTSSLRDGKVKARRHRDRVTVKAEEPEVLFGDDEHQSSPAIDHSENEVVHELQQAHQLAQVAINSDPDSERDEVEVSELEAKNTEGHSGGGRGDRRKRDAQRPTQGFSSPLARFGHSSAPAQAEDSQPDNRPTVEELDRFANDMNDLIDSFCKRAKSRVLKLVNGRRQLAVD